MAKKPKDGGKTPSMDKPNPEPPLDTSGLQGAAGPPAGAPPMGPDPMSAMLGGGPPPADPMSAALTGGAPPPDAGMGAPPMGGGELPPELGGVPPQPGPVEGADQMAQIGQQFGPVVAAAMTVSPEVQEVLSKMINEILMSQSGGGIPMGPEMMGGAPPMGPPMGGPPMMPGGPM